jgi:hypothetical protein
VHNRYYSFYENDANPLAESCVLCIVLLPYSRHLPTTFIYPSVLDALFILFLFLYVRFYVLFISRYSLWYKSTGKVSFFRRPDVMHSSSVDESGFISTLTAGTPPLQCYAVRLYGAGCGVAHRFLYTYTAATGTGIQRR